MAIPLAALPASYSCERNFPAKGSPKKWEGRTTQLEKQTTSISNYKYQSVLNK
jgi:dihydrofolate reductase